MGSISKVKLIQSFENSLNCRLSDEFNSQRDSILQNMWLDCGVSNGDQTTLIFDVGGVLTSYFTPSGGKKQKVGSIVCNNNDGVWLAMQKIFFDTDTELPTLKKNLIRNVPEFLSRLADRE